MVVDPQILRIEGIYEQRQPGNFMLRVKVAAGTISAEQALQVAGIADRFAGGTVHLTTRGSIELHWLKGENLAEVWRMLAAVGLTTRGACGGAVRGVTCGPAEVESFPVALSLARKLHHHFTRNPHFEGLPKKFKIGVFATGEDGRHLIQDLALVLAGTGGGSPRYDVWTAGGLGREPSPAFLLEAGVAEERVISLAEAVVRLYREKTPKGKRLKHLVREIGREEFVRLVGEARGDTPLPVADSFSASFLPSPEGGAAGVEAPVFAGELSADGLRALAAIAREFADGFMSITGRQNVFFRLADAARRDEALRALKEAGLGGKSREQRVDFRICPGSHECRMGLAPTRDLALALIGAMGGAGEGLPWSIAGCPNSCSQPQLAGVGIVTVKSVKGEDGERHPLFDLYHREGEGFGAAVRQGITLDELVGAVSEMG